jgi:hypothetical protein
MPRTRNAQGRYETTHKDDAAPYPKNLINDDNVNIFSFPKLPPLFYRIWIILCFILMFSPWIFLVIKNNSITNISQKVTDFYDNNFSCKGYSNNTDLKSERSDKGF